MVEFERLVDEILKQKPEVDRGGIAQMIEEKKRRIGAGYLTDQGALFLVASDLGVSLDRITRSDLRIKDLYVGASDVAILGRVLAVYPTKTYAKKDGSTGKYRRLVLFDWDASIPVTLWEEKADEPTVAIAPETALRITGGYVRAGLDGEPVLHLGTRGAVEPAADLDEASLPNLSDITKSPSEIKVARRHLCIEGTVKTAPRSSEFTGRVGSLRRVIQYQLGGATGPPVRVALWGADESLLNLEVSSRIRVANVRSKVLPQGEIELHGDEGTLVTLLSRPSGSGRGPTGDSAVFRLLSFGSVRTSRDGEPVLNALVAAPTGDLKRLVAKGVASQSLSEIAPGDLFDCTFRRLDENAFICDRREDLKPFSGEAPHPGTDSFVGKIRRTTPQSPPSVFEVIALSRTTLNDVTTKDGSAVRKAEALVGDETGEIKLVAWRDLVDTLTGIVPGQRLRLSFVEPQPGRDGAAILVVRPYSQVVKH